MGKRTRPSQLSALQNTLSQRCALVLNLRFCRALISSPRAGLCSYNPLRQPPSIVRLNLYEVRCQIHLAYTGGSATRPVFETGLALGGPSPQSVVDGGLAGFEVTGYGLGRPALDVKRDDRLPALSTRRHLVVGRVAARR